MSRTKSVLATLLPLYFFKTIFEKGKKIVLRAGNTEEKSAS
jgi:hypothetical protein